MVSFFLRRLLKNEAPRKDSGPRRAALFAIGAMLFGIEGSDASEPWMWMGELSLGGASGPRIEARVGTMPGGTRPLDGSCVEAGTDMIDSSSIVSSSSAYSVSSSDGASANVSSVIQLGVNEAVSPPAIEAAAEGRAVCTSIESRRSVLFFWIIR